MELAELAKHASGFFVTKTRPPEAPGKEGEAFISVKKRRPTWIMAMVKAVHDDGDWLPDDYKYTYISQTLDLLADGVNPDEPQLEADVYTSDLCKWFTSHFERAAYVDEAVQNWGHSDKGVVDDIMAGQVWEKEDVFRKVVDALKERLAEIDLGVDGTMEDVGPRRNPLDWSPREEKED